MSGKPKKEEVVQEVRERIKRLKLGSGRIRDYRYFAAAFPSGSVGHPNFPSELCVMPDDGSHVDELVGKAADDPVAYDAACCRASYELRHGQIASALLVSFAADVLAGVVKRPPDRVGKPGGSKQYAYQMICGLIALVVENYGYPQLATMRADTPTLRVTSLRRLWQERA